MTYASGTEVSVVRSQGEIRVILSKNRAVAFAFAESENMAMVQFEIGGRRIKFVMPLPVHGIAMDKRERLLTERQVEQRHREKWRALTIAIKAKLECVAAGLTTVEEEFLAHILLPNGSTVGKVVLPEIEASYQNKQMPPLLGMRS